VQSDYVEAAQARGIARRKVMRNHAFRNALVPVITLTTLLFGELLGGAVLTEQVFTIPGFGKMIVDSVFNRDYAVVQGVVLIVAIGFLMLNLLADVLYVLINPKMRG
jgi:peptide/nickel transport system permease protein